MNRLSWQFRLIFAIVLASLILASCASPIELHGSVYQTPPEAPEIPLKTTRGQSFSLSEHRGNVILVYFGYTHCPDICPATLADLKWVKEQLGAAKDEVQVVFVSIDPDRDDAESIRNYLDRFNEAFIGLSGSESDLQPITAGYGVLAQRDPSGDENYTMTHTSRVFLIDQEGNLRTNYTFDEPRENILADVRQLTDG